MKCPFCIKVCTKCGRLLVAYSGNFKRQKEGKWGLRANCKRCDKQYREENKEYCAEYNKQYREERKEQIAEYKKQYYEENPHIYFNNNNKRRSKEENQGSGVTKEQWLEMMIFFDFKCAYSGEKLNNKEVRTVDHIIALNNGGLNEIWNCVPMYKSYNMSKHTKDMEQWYRQQEYFSEERLNKIYAWIEYAYEKWGKEE